MVEELHAEVLRAAASMPEPARLALTQHGKEDMRAVLSDAKEAFLQMGLRLQKLWPQLPAQERRPWEAAFKRKQEEYNIAMEAWRQRSRGPEPKRPAGAFFDRIRAKREEEWSKLYGYEVRS